MVNAALDEKPALEQIERGEVAADTYRNDDLGLTYTYPTTWEPVPAKDAAGSACKDEYRATHARRARRLFAACCDWLHLTLPVE